MFFPPRFIRFNAASIIDATGDVSPGSILIGVEGGIERRDGLLVVDAPRIAAVGSPAEVDDFLGTADAAVIDRPDHVITPAFANAHCHLDLTHIGPRPHDAAGGFGAFVDLVRKERRTEDEQIAASVAEGIRLSLAGGVLAVGDIAGSVRGRTSLAPWRTLAGSPLQGVSYLEFFAIGKAAEAGQARAAEALAQARREGQGRIAIGLQPHAPNTVGLAGYRWAVEQRVPLATHLAETAEEREFIGAGTGPQRAFLEQLGLWDDAALAEIGRGSSPVAHLAPVLDSAGFLVAHVNDASDADIEILARTGTAVAYCPRASDYFGAASRFGPHRYRDMIAAGIPVALGTDSIINLPAGTERLSTLDEARYLWRRDRTDPMQLLAMATTAGGRALGLSEGAFLLGAGTSVLGLAAVPGRSWAEALGSEAPPELLLARK